VVVQQLKHTKNTLASLVSSDTCFDAS